MIQFSELQLQVRDLARQLAHTRIAPRAAEFDEREEFRTDVLELYREHDLLALYVPAEYGGGGTDLTTQCLVIEEIAQVCASSAVTLQCQGTACHTLDLGCSPGLRQTYFERIAREQPLFSWCLTEAEAGSDSAGMRTRAVRDGDGYVLNGEKVFVTNAGYSDLIIVMAVTDPGRGHGGISAFLVEADAPGLMVGRPEKKMGLRASATASLVLQDVRVHRDDRIGAEGEGFSLAMRTLDKTRPLIAALALGIAEGAYRYALDYARQRVAFGKPIAEQQAIQFMLADMATRIEAARWLLYQTTARHDQGLSGLSRYSAMAKLFASDVAMQVTTDAVQVLGGHGYMRAHPVERMMRDAKVTQIFEGTNQIQRLVIARSLLRES